MLLKMFNYLSPEKKSKENKKMIIQINNQRQSTFDDNDLQPEPESRHHHRHHHHYHHHHHHHRHHQQQQSRAVHFAESIDDEKCSTNVKKADLKIEKNDNKEIIETKRKTKLTDIDYQQYNMPDLHSDMMYLLPEDPTFQMISHSSPSSPAAGSNTTILSNVRRKCFSQKNSDFESTCANNNNNSNSSNNTSTTSNWKLRTRYYSRRRGQEKSIDCERQPSICSDSETDSIIGQNKIEDLLNTSGKKWSLPLPVVICSSESDSASSWSARSDECTEDEPSPMPSPSASMHSNEEYNMLTGVVSEVSKKKKNNTISKQKLPSPPSPSSSSATSMHSTQTALKMIELGAKKLSIKMSNDNSVSQHNDKHLEEQQKENVADEEPMDPLERNKKGNRGKLHRKKKLTRAAESHHFQRMKTTNYGRCIICDAYVYFWGFECIQCQLICHKKCVKKMAIMCPRVPLPARASILNVDLDEMDIVPPILIEKCTLEIERRYISRNGIYRMSGVASRVEKLLKSFESGPHLIDLSDVGANDLASVLKVFLRQLKHPLITNNVYKEFIEIGRAYRLDANLMEDGLAKGGHSKMIQNVHSAIVRLSNNHQITLKFMIKHLSRIGSHQEQNNMTPAALGIIFAPTIFRPRDTMNDLYTEVFEAGPQARVIELLIRFYEQIFETESNFIDKQKGLTSSLQSQLLSEMATAATTSFAPKQSENDNAEHKLQPELQLTPISTSYYHNSESGATGSSSQTSAPSSANLTSTSVSLSTPLSPPLTSSPLLSSAENDPTSEQASNENAQNFHCINSNSQLSSTTLSTISVDNNDQLSAGATQNNVKDNNRNIFELCNIEHRGYESETQSSEPICHLHNCSTSKTFTFD